MCKAWVALVLFMLLNGCAGDEARRFWFGLNDEERAQAVVNKLSPHCEAMGHQRGSQSWQQCMQEMYRLYAATQGGQGSTGSLAEGLRSAGTILQGNASTMTPIPMRQTDQACMTACMRSYGYGYCDSKCSY